MSRKFISRVLALTLVAVLAIGTLQIAGFADATGVTVTSVTASLPTVPSAGGDVTITVGLIASSGITVNVSVGAFDGQAIEPAATAGTTNVAVATSGTTTGISLAMPANSGSNDVSYTIKAKVGDGDWSNSDFDTVKVLGTVTPKYTVTFNSKGGTPVPQAEIKSGETVPFPDIPTKTGCDFVGWYKDEQLTIPWNFATDTVAGDITLYAKWKVVGDIQQGPYNLVPPNPITANGITASVYFRAKVPDNEIHAGGSDIGEIIDKAKPGNEVIAIVNLSGTTQRAGKFTVGLRSDLADVSLSDTEPVSAGQYKAYDVWYEFFTMPSADVDDFTLTFTFTDGSTTTSSSSGGGGGGGGGWSPSTPTTQTSSNVSANGSVSGTTAVSELNQALKSSSGDEAVVRTRNATSITPATLKSLAKAASDAGKAAVLQADTVGADGKLQGRLYVEPAKLADLKTELKLGVNTAGQKVETRKAQFEKYFSNNLSVISCAQQGSFGAKLKIAAKVELPKNTSNLNFYSYDAASGKYTKIETEYRVDKNGFLIFTTELAGDIIISDGPLAKK